MPIAVTEDHESLRATALRWAQTHCPADRAPPGGRDHRVGGAAGRLGEDGRPGLARPPPDRGAGRAGLHAGGAGRRARGARVTPSSPGRCSPTVLVSAALARTARGPASVAAGVVARTGRRLHHGRRGPGRHAPPLAGGGRRRAGPRRCGAPGARAAHRPPGPRPSRLRVRGRDGSCSIGRRWGARSPSRRSRRSTAPAPWGS